MPDARASGLFFLALLPTALGLQINPQLLTFFVQMASFQTERFSRVRDVVLVAAEFGEDRLAFEVVDTGREGSRLLGRGRCTGQRGFPWQCEFDGGGIDLVSGC